jgi:phage host-nuclease inhibitor protein Gam
MADKTPDRVYALEPSPEGEHDLTPEPGWSIPDLATLEWALERLSAVKAQIRENDELTKQALERFQLRVESLKRAPLAQAEFLETAILAYATGHRAELLKGGKKKSREFPGGTVGWRKGGGRLQVLDEAKALEWAKQQPLELGLYHVEVKLSKSGLSEYFKTSGEVPPGCDVDEETETAYVKPAELVLDVGPMPKLLPEGKP